jgi:hypothetical protein
VPQIDPPSPFPSSLSDRRHRCWSKLLLGLALLLAPLAGSQSLSLTGTAEAANTASWSPAPSMPVALGEVAGGLIAGTIYVVGEGRSATLGHGQAAAWRLDRSRATTMPPRS